MRYKNIEEIPDWGRPTISNLISLNLLQGDGKDLNLSEDMVRVLVINDRAGLYGKLSEQSIVVGLLKFTLTELKMLQKIVYAEARGEDIKGQVLVVNVIINRVNSPKFPNTIEKVIFQPNQFEPIRNGSYEKATPQEITISAVNKAISGEDYSQGALYFTSTKGLEGSWHEKNLTKLFTYGGHTFFK